MGIYTESPCHAKTRLSKTTKRQLCPLSCRLRCIHHSPGLVLGTTWPLLYSADVSPAYAFPQDFGVILVDLVYDVDNHIVLYDAEAVEAVLGRRREVRLRRVVEGGDAVLVAVDRAHLLADDEGHLLALVGRRRRDVGRRGVRVVGAQRRRGVCCSCVDSDSGGLCGRVFNLLYA